MCGFSGFRQDFPDVCADLQDVDGIFRISSGFSLFLIGFPIFLSGFTGFRQDFWIVDRISSIVDRVFWISTGFYKISCIFDRIFRISTRFYCFLTGFPGF